MTALAISKRLYEACPICKLIFANIAWLDILASIYVSRGPGSYENEEKTTFRYVLDHQPMSRRGYAFNARTEKRKSFEPKVIRRAFL
jgi:hypothetical protein